MRLETKMGCTTVILIAAMLAISWTAHVRVRVGDAVAHETLTRRIPTILEVRDVRSNVSRSVRALESYVLFGVDEEASVKFRQMRAEHIRKAQEALESLQSGKGGLDLGADEPKLIQVRAHLARLAEEEVEVERLNETRTPENVAKAYTLLQHDIVTDEEGLFAEVGEISSTQTAIAQGDAERLSKVNRETLAALWVATVLGALVSGTLMYLLIQRIVDSLDQLAQRANAIASGDLTGEALDDHSRDLLGELAGSMNRMQDSLGGIIGTVVDTAGSLTGSAVSMRTASDEIHKRIDLQSQQTHQAATAMQEMSASIAEVSRHTQSAAETARSAAQTAREGGAIVKQVLGSMHSIATAVSETSETVGLLGEDSKRISQIVTVIDEIARKTNLLALNAAIEAARAGDQGRGFAVVAGEVRRLAESTAQATGEIGTMIREIQERTRIAIASMDAGTGTVQEGVVTTTQAGEALEKIIGMAERVDRMITQIAIAASQQATAADQSSASLDSIHSLSHDNLTEMATTAAGIEGLRGTAVRLEKQVDRFHVVQGKAA